MAFSLQRELSAIKAHKVQVILAVLLTFTCGVVLKLATFPMNFIAGPSSCVTTVDQEPACLEASTPNATNPAFCQPDQSTETVAYVVNNWLKVDVGCSEKYEFISASRWTRLSFLIWFGVAKATMNFITGYLTDRFGHVMVVRIGWLMGIPGVLMVLYGPSLGWVTASNVFVGLQQGTVWSGLIFLLIKKLGREHAGLACGINETMGYTGVALTNLAMPAILKVGGARVGAYYIEGGILLSSFVISIMFLKDSPEESRAIHEGSDGENGDRRSATYQLATVISKENIHTTEVRQTTYAFLVTTILNPSTMVLCCAGACINFVTALAWGTITQWMKDGQSGHWGPLSTAHIAAVGLCYELPKGLCQVGFGILGDRYNRKHFIVCGLATCAFALGGIALAGITTISSPAEEESDLLYAAFCALSVLLGVGTAAVYTNCQAAVAEASEDDWRSTAIGTYRFWRDSGFVSGAILGALITDSIGPGGSVSVASGLVCFVAVLCGVYHRPVQIQIPHGQAKDVEGDQAMLVVDSVDA